MAQRVNAPARWLGSLALLASLLDAGCSRSPDVVATRVVEPEKSDAKILRVGADMEPCVAGYYEGVVSADPALGIPFSGQISFTLVQRGNEIKVLQDTAALTGMNDNGSAMFGATISSQTACVDGAIVTTLDDGWYQASGSGQIKFHGRIKGQYTAQFMSFGGKWSALLLLAGPTVDAGIEVGGIWSASLNPNK